MAGLKAVSSALSESEIAAAQELLLRRGGETICGGTRTHFQLSQCVFQILEQWEAPPHVQLVGLSHTAYKSVGVSRVLFNLEERSLLRSHIGESAENLAFLYARADLESEPSNIQLPDIEAALAAHDSGAHADGDGETVLALVLVSIAAMAAGSELDSGAPSAWLARTSRLAALLRGWRFAPPIFDHCQAVVEGPAETALLECYKQLSGGNPIGSSQLCELRRSVEATAHVAEPWVMLGLHELSLGNAGLAAHCGTRAVECIVSWNCSWDKRIAETQCLALARFLQRSQDASPEGLASAATQTKHFLAHATTGLPELYGRLERLNALGSPALTELNGFTQDVDEDEVDPEELSDIPVRFMDYVAGFRDNVRDARMAMYPGLTSQEFWDGQEFALVRELERRFPEIIAEFGAIPPQLFHAEAEKVGREGDWDVFILYERGRKQGQRAHHVPVTMSIVEAHSTVRTHSGLIYFSRLSPNTTIEPHTGPTNLRLRCHLGLAIPSRCSIEINGVTRSWETGKCLVFDDSFKHSVQNLSDEERVVLIVDIWHPELSPKEIRFLEGLDRHIGHVAEGLTRYWRRNEKAALLAAT